MFFYGINSLTNSIFYAALEAASKMAEYMKDVQKAKKWHELFLHGHDKMDVLLWNESYYEQLLSEDIDTYKYQYGTGCLSDQLLGQELAHLYGIGYILPEEHVKKAREFVDTCIGFGYPIMMDNYYAPLLNRAFTDEVYRYSRKKYAELM